MTCYLCVKITKDINLDSYRQFFKKFVQMPLIPQTTDR